MILSVGDINIELSDYAARNLPQNLKPYIKKKSLSPLATCDGKHGKLSQTATGVCLFNSGYTWRVDKTDAGIKLNILMGHETKIPYQILSLNDTLTEGKVLLDDTLLPESDDGFLLRAPLHEIWTSFLLMRGRGLLVHGLGVLIDNKVKIFVGKSGVGKSTLAHVFSKNKIGKILSDDRLIIRPCDDGYMVYGTPWHGEAHFYSSDSGLLDSIHFLRHALENKAVTLKPQAAASLMYATCFIAGWPRTPGLQFVLNCCADIVSQTRCFDFAFTPDKDALLAAGVEI